ncbi:uncharacterized protein LOC143882801 [Tasmannia lanceolata]|uniref:uncharacterized protein LOC143882801 n=1 Tax=Tasmannia lanceolata TaxID=3420 RepID=UPI004062BB89
MTVEFCYETSSSSSSSSSPNWSISPRISFSHDLSQTEKIPIDSSRLDSPSPDFDFCITNPNQQGSSSADELFFNGKILPLPIQIQPKTTHVFTLPNEEIPQPKSNPLPSPLPPPQTQKKESLREIMEMSKQEEKSNSKSFWHFTRSNSLNGTKKSLICSLSPLLSRSNSTGSTNPSPRRSQLKDGYKSSQNSPSNSNTKISWPSSSTSSSSVQKPPSPLKKNNSGGRNLYGSHSNGGVHINPVLNVPPPYISKGTTTLFSSFFTGKDTKNKKKSSSVPHPSYFQRI